MITVILVIALVAFVMILFNVDEVVEEIIRRLL